MIKNYIFPSFLIVLTVLATISQVEGAANLFIFISILHTLLFSFIYIKEIREHITNKIFKLTAKEQSQILDVLAFNCCVTIGNLFLLIWYGWIAIPIILLFHLFNLFMIYNIVKEGE